MVQAHRDHRIPVFRKGLSSRLAREEIGRKFGSQRTLQACTPCTAYAALRETAIGTELPTSAPQRIPSGIGGSTQSRRAWPPGPQLTLN